MCSVLITHLHPTKLTIVFLRNLPALDAQLTATHRRHNLQSFIGVRRANISNPYPSRAPVKAFHTQSFAVALCISSLHAALHRLSSHSSQQVHKQFSLAIGTISAPQLTIPVTLYVHAILAANPLPPNGKDVPCPYRLHTQNDNGSGVVRFQRQFCDGTIQDMTL